MKIYIAARYARKSEIEEVYTLLEANGHSITNKWTQQDSIKPYQDNKEKAAQYVTEDLAAIRAAETVIFFSEFEPDARGCYIELGYAIALSESGQKIDIYVIEPGDNPSMFFFHPSVKIVKDIKEISRI